MDVFEQQILDAFAEYPCELLDRIFDTKMAVCKCILSDTPPGGNNVKLPRRKKFKA